MEVIQFSLTLRASWPVPAGVLEEVGAWREKLRADGHLGQDPARYGGYGYGNISRRLPPYDRACPFVITGSQTGALPVLSAAHYAIVTACDTARHHVIAHGSIPPSSECVTHFMVYVHDTSARWVMHVHDPVLWHIARRRDVPVTDPAVAQGTPAMAEAIAALFVTTDVRERRLFAMGGHADGLVSFGRTAEEAQRALSMATGLTDA